MVKYKFRIKHKYTKAIYYNYDRINVKKLVDLAVDCMVR